MRPNKDEDNMENNFRILIIDDNRNIHRDFIKVLKMDKPSSALDELDNQLFGDQPNNTPHLALPAFHIDTATQGQEGVNYIKKAIDEGNPYALAFIDMRMPPGWDGIETIKHIWEHDRDIQTVICTAYSDYTWEETVKQLDINDNLLILKKPFDNIAVRQLTCALTKKWQLMREAKNYSLSLENLVQERTDSLQQSLSLIRATLDSSNDGILAVNSSEKIIDCNQKFGELWGIPSHILETKNKRTILDQMVRQLKHQEEFRKIFERGQSTIDPINIEKLRLANGKVFEVYSQPYTLKGEIIGRVWSFMDATKRIRLEERLEYQAMHDALTDLPNRILLFDRIRQLIAQSKREGEEFALIFFDLDRFKLINDSLGHKAGDELLVTFARRVENEIREEDTLARIGGDEFVLLLQGLSGPNDVIHIVTKLLDGLKKPLTLAGREIVISTSMGIAIYPQDGETPDDLLTNADLAMYKAKQAGADQFHFFTSEINQKGLEHLESEIELRQAITQGDFFLTYQPQFKMIGSAPMAAEALIRWNHQKKGIILPMDFIPLAEETGLIVPIGEWALREACKQNKEWQDMGLPPIRVAVNIATRQFRQQDFVKQVKTILEETGLDPQYLEIEITENVIVNNEDIIKVVTELKNLGVHIAIDDFGTGVTSISHLKRLPLDLLKIDKSFIQNIDTNQSDEVIIKAIVAMAKCLNLEVLAEGVETKKQLTFLDDLSCENIQGFYFSEPLSSEEFSSLLMEYSKKMEEMENEK